MTAATAAGWLRGRSAHIIADAEKMHTLKKSAAPAHSQNIRPFLLGTSVNLFYTAVALITMLCSPSARPLKSKRHRVPSSPSSTAV